MASSRSPPGRTCPAATHDAARRPSPPLPPAAARRRQPAPPTGAGASPSSSLAVASVLVTAQAGAALGGSPRRPRAPPSRASPPALPPTVVAARRLAVVGGRSASRPATTRARSSTRSPRPATARRSCRGRPSVGRVAPPRCPRRLRPASRAAGPLAALAAAVGARRLPSGYGGAVRCPYCAADDDKVVDSRPADDGAAVRRRRECLACGRRFTTYERVEELPLVVVKRSGGDRAVRPREAAGRHRAGGRGQRDRRRRRSTRWRTTIEEQARAPGPEVRERVHRPGRARAPAHARPGLLRALRLGLQGLRRRRRLRARGGRAAEDDRARSDGGPISDGSRRILRETLAMTSV